MNTIIAEFWITDCIGVPWTAVIHNDGKVQLAYYSDGKRILTNTFLEIASLSDIPFWQGHLAIPARVCRWMANTKMHGCEAVANAAFAAKARALAIAKHSKL